MKATFEAHSSSTNTLFPYPLQQDSLSKMHSFPRPLTIEL